MKARSPSHREMAEEFASAQVPDPPPPHPLEDIAWRAFDLEHAQDPTTLGRFLAGGPEGGKPRSPYRTIAGHVLDRMEARGLLWRNDQDQFGPHQPGDSGGSWPGSPCLGASLEARDNCRSRLVGLRCRWDGEEWTIVATKWDADGQLELRLDGGDFRPYLLVDPEGVTLIDPWPAKCCKPSKAKLREALARRRREGGGRR